MYAWSYTTIFIIMITGILLWSLFKSIISNSKTKHIKKLWVTINVIGILISFYGILSFTVLGRQASDSHVFVLMSSFYNEFYREMLMNAFLYFPFGLTLAIFIGPWSILVGFLMSVSIETWQYFAGTGIAQGTDLLMNTLGCVIGCMPWFIIKNDK